MMGLLAFPQLLLYNAPRTATVAQQAEQPLRKRRVKGSIPFGGSVSEERPQAFFIVNHF